MFFSSKLMFICMFVQKKENEAKLKRTKKAARDEMKVEEYYKWFLGQG